MGCQSLEPDEMVDCARLFLRARYRQELEALQMRLAAFDQVNWDGVKQTLRNRMRLLGPPDAEMKTVLTWLEELLTE